MASSIYIFGHLQPLRIESQDDDPNTIWVRTPSETVSLSLTGEQRAELRRALDVADAMEAVS